LTGCENIVIMGGPLGVSIKRSFRKGRIMYIVTKPAWRSLQAVSCGEGELSFADGLHGLLAGFVAEIIRKSVGARIAYTKEYHRYLLAGRCIDGQEGLEKLEPGSAAYVLRAPQVCGGSGWLILSTACVYRYSRFRLERDGKRYVVPAQLALCGGDQDVISCISNMMSGWLAIMVPKYYPEEFNRKLGCWRVNPEKRYYKICWRRIPEEKLVPAP